MPSATSKRKIAAPAQELWELICDPHHLPRWWPRVERVEAVEGFAFTQVLRSDRGKIVRADFLTLDRDEQQLRVLWAQQIEGTPFARVLASSETEVRLVAANDGAATEVAITLTQTLPRMFGRGSQAPRVPAVTPFSQSSYGLFARIGSPMVRRAAASTVKEALNGLERIAG
jgi:uncharacterized protein YndB with AHSA1/START domain